MDIKTIKRWLSELDYTPRIPEYLDMARVNIMSEPGDKFFSTDFDPRSRIGWKETDVGRLLLDKRAYKDVNVRKYILKRFADIFSRNYFNFNCDDTLKCIHMTPYSGGGNMLVLTSKTGCCSISIPFYVKDGYAHLAAGWFDLVIELKQYLGADLRREIEVILNLAFSSDYETALIACWLEGGVIV